MLEQTWRWYGEKDLITLDKIKQTGATGIVTALYNITTGNIWPYDEIIRLKNKIEGAGLTWSVVESIPVHEDIKKRTGKYQEYIRNFKESIANLGKAGIKTICYNFMPVLDWSRTNLKVKHTDGSITTQFERNLFAVIDINILKRTGAEKSYPDSVVRKAKEIFNSLREEKIKELTDTFLLGFPGTGETFTLDEIKSRIDGYKDIDEKKLKNNLFSFLGEIIPVAEQSGVAMAIHPDDPPFPLMGLPRIVSTLQDCIDIIDAVDSPANGLTFCTGSLGSGFFNNLTIMAEVLAHRINFAHLRNVKRNENLDFSESYFFEGDVDMFEVVKTLVFEEEKRKKEGRNDWKIPFRPDHGNTMFDDISKDYYPGYSLYGRMKGLAEIRGLETGIRRSFGLNCTDD